MGIKVLKAQMGEDAPVTTLNQLLLQQPDLGAATTFMLVTVDINKEGGKCAAQQSIVTDGKGESAALLHFAAIAHRRLEAQYLAGMAASLGLDTVAKVIMAGLSKVEQDDPGPDIGVLDKDMLATLAAVGKSAVH
ncbi:MAG: hypothetical protein E6Q97_17965 [Desulfurellales bacterium]|nr:MAG: hypothetical protein E6Q97_17965 [Desulfurellales bacterium]